MSDDGDDPSGPAVLLAGGHSTRFGDDDKALAPIDGTPMVRHVADRIAPAIDSLVVSCRAGQRASIGAAFEGYEHPVRTVTDPVPDLGPLAGIQAALGTLDRDGRTDAEYAFVVACDMPFVTAGLVRALFDAASGADAAVPRDEGWCQATCAVYRTTTTRGACRAAHDRGDRRARAPLADLRVRYLDRTEVAAVAPPRALDSVNTPPEYEAAVRRLGGEPA